MSTNYQKFCGKIKINPASVVYPACGTGMESVLWSTDPWEPWRWERPVSKRKNEAVIKRRAVKMSRKNQEKSITQTMLAMVLILVSSVLSMPSYRAANPYLIQ